MSWDITDLILALSSCTLEYHKAYPTAAAPHPYSYHEVEGSGKLSAHLPASTGILGLTLSPGKRVSYSGSAPPGYEQASSSRKPSVPLEFSGGKVLNCAMCPFWIIVFPPTLHISPRQIRTVKAKAMASPLCGCNCAYGEGHVAWPDGLEHRVRPLETGCSSSNSYTSGSPQKGELPFPRAGLSFP